MKVHITGTAFCNSDYLDVILAAEKKIEELKITRENGINKYWQTYNRHHWSLDSEIVKDLTDFERAVLVGIRPFGGEVLGDKVEMYGND
jgi:hypothetical protein